MKSSTLSYRPASGEIVSSEEDAAASAFAAIESAKISIVRESVENCLRGYMRAREDDLLIYPHITAKGNNGLSLKGPKIYRDAVRPLLEKEESAMAVIKCANALGTLNGVLVTQRSLDFLRWDYPALFRVSFDFSPEGSEIQSASHHQVALSAVGNAIRPGRWIFHFRCHRYRCEFQLKHSRGRADCLFRQ